MQFDPSPVLNPGERAPEPGIALCLSGGGYRAMLFHVGCIWRLNEAGLLGTLKRVSSVSGGSITAAVLGMNWIRMGLTGNTRTSTEKLTELLVNPVRSLASTTIDKGAIIGGLLLPGSISDHVTDKYKSHLFHDKTLQDLPLDTEGPRFVINATSVQTGVSVRFSRPYIADYRVGRIRNPALPLARAVAASSAFPPVLSPCEIKLSDYGLQFEPHDPAAMAEDLHTGDYLNRLVLSDGGVYDNLGLETAWKSCQTILVSDGGGRFEGEQAPHGDWAQHSKRVLDVIDSQVRALRNRQLMGFFARRERSGTLWTIRQNNSTVPDPALQPDPVRTSELAKLPTRLKEMPSDLQERLINWGYAACDSSIRQHWMEDLPAPPGLPYPGTPI